MPQNLHMPPPSELMAQTQARDTVLLCLENDLYSTYLKTCLQDQDFDFELIAKKPYCDEGFRKPQNHFGAAIGHE